MPYFTSNVRSLYLQTSGRVHVSTVIACGTGVIFLRFFGEREKITPVPQARFVTFFNLFQAFGIVGSEAKRREERRGDWRKGAFARLFASLPHYTGNRPDVLSLREQERPW